MLNLISKNKKNISSFLILAMVMIVFIIPFLAGAVADEGKNPPPADLGKNPVSTTIKIINPFKCSGDGCTIPGFIKAIINDILLPIGGVIAVLMIMYAGFKYVTARGNPAKIQEAHQALLYAAIGAAILLGAWVISEAIGATINQLKA